MKIGMMMAREMIAIVEPRRVSFRAWCACPLRRSSCPGSVPSPVSSSGAPRNIAGMKSMNVWVIAIAVMKIRRVVIGRFEMRVVERMDMATRLMWIPGMSPVVVPAMMPRSRGIARFNIGD